MTENMMMALIFCVLFNMTLMLALSGGAYWIVAFLTNYLIIAWADRQ